MVAYACPADLVPSGQSAGAMLVSCTTQQPEMLIVPDTKGLAWEHHDHALHEVLLRDVVPARHHLLQHAAQPEMERERQRQGWVSTQGYYPWLMRQGK